MDKILETNSSFHMKYYEKSRISIFQKFYASINKILILEER